ncbi:unnamed protein product [Adineta ricciae]|uniref:Uncharacterized protein n=1 Tax=Adineta ricciae TaxID=249248 RepID=A0A814PVM2_ADIRI|nr:unnamed protein product [Adineta ricciae]
MLLSVDEHPIYSQLKSIAYFILSVIAAGLVISIGLVTSTQISGYHLQNMYFPVQKNNCQCDCWDGFFRGKYSRGGYKTFYFNYERQMITILCVVLFYAELLRHVLLNLVLRKQLLLVLFIPSLYSNFYGIWSIINYLNDHDYQRMLKSQIYFSITELIASYIFYQCLSSQNKLHIPSSFIYLLCTIASLHILLAFGELNADQLARNIGLILSDIISLTWTGVLLMKNTKLRPNKRALYIWVCVAFCLWLFYHMFCPFRETLD